MTPNCKDCRFFHIWSQTCSQPFLVATYGTHDPVLAVCMRDLDEACGMSGTLFEARQSIGTRIATAIAKKLGWLQ